MCKLSAGNPDSIKVNIPDGNKYTKSIQKIHYWENAKCELKNEKHKGKFKCEEIMMQKILGGRKTEYTVGCKTRVAE
jgi:hypothetical protein